METRGISNDSRGRGMMTQRSPLRVAAPAPFRHGPGQRAVARLTLICFLALLAHGLSLIHI